MIHQGWLVYLAIPTAWTVFFSLFNAPGVRRWRNFGWPLCYVLGCVMFWSIGWRQAGATWLAVGFGTGLLYYLYELWATRKREDPEAKARLRTILHGAFVWPIMLPEVIEFFLADAGVLRSGPPTSGEHGEAQPKGDVEPRIRQARSTPRKGSRRSPRSRPAAFGPVRDRPALGDFPTPASPAAQPRR